MSARYHFFQISLQSGINDSDGSPSGWVSKGSPGIQDFARALPVEPQFRAFGWSNAAQVISDPSSGDGGPQSVNWSFSDDDGAFRLGDIDATPVSARGFGLSVYHCFSEVEDALQELERYTMGYVDSYLHDGQEMIREAKRRRKRLQDERRRLEIS